MFRTIIKAVLLPITILMAVLLLLADMASMFSPTRWQFPSAMALGFPWLFIINAIFGGFWLWRGKKWWYICLLPFLLGLFHFRAYFGFSSASDIPDYAIKVMSFNMHYFDALSIKDKKARLENQSKMLDFIIKEAPDILFAQEFSGDFDAATTKRAAEVLNPIYPYQCSGWGGLLTYSKFPLSNCNDVKFEGTYNAYSFADATIGSKNIRLYCFHFQSIRLGADADKILSNEKIAHIDEEDAQKFYKGVFAKLSIAFERRALQVQKITASISSSPHPVIACGDLNDVPASYAYSKINSFLNDTYTEKGAGFGSTYAGKLPWLRIDYIFTDPKLKIYSHYVHKNSFSDHYAISSQLSF
jgi:endonuclease/exonuclease/phosphatase family metal-dependent hydrolase